MGLKLRLGLALSGLALSSMFGVNMLSGIKDYVDTTGNIMVDIADGIEMVSKGIEALEHYIHPSDDTDGVSPGSPAIPLGSPLVPPGSPAVPPGSSPVLPGSPAAPPGSLPLDAHPAPGDQPAVFCQKGKCYPYDPTRLKGVNLEAKPGVIIQAAPPTPRPASPNTKPSPVTGKAGQKGKKAKNDDEDEKEDKRGRGAAKPKPDRSQVAASTTPSPPIIISNPILVDVNVTNNTNSSTNATVSPAKKVLKATRGVLERLSKLLVKLVYRIFPWNRRARRRLIDGKEDDEL